MKKLLKVHKFVYTFSKAAQWIRLQSLEGYFWPRGLMFDTPASKFM